MGDLIRGYHKIADQDYFRASDKYMSSTRLKEYAQCPKTFDLYQKGMLRRPESSVAQSFGTAAHMLILEGEALFNQAYAVEDGPVNPRTGKPYGSDTKRHSDWLETLDRPTISTADHTKMCEMWDSFYSHDGIAAVMSLGGTPELVARTEMLDVECQSKIDWLSEEHNVMLDLKTCRDLDDFEHDAKRFGYVKQMAFYEAMVGEIDGEVPDQVYVAAVEKKAPYRAGLWRIRHDSLYEANQWVSRQLTRYRKSLTTNTWLSHFDNTRSL